MIRALIVDDEPAAAGIIRYFINMSHLPIEIVGEARDGAAAMGLLERQNPALVFLDIQMPNMNGFELMQARPDYAYIVITAYESFQYAQQALRLGAKDILLKPVEFDALERAITRALGWKFTGNALTNSVIEYVRGHYGEKIEVNDLARRNYTTASHIARTFKRYMGTTVVTYLHQVRIENAAEMIRSTDLGIKEISERCGYDNINNFYKHFKDLLDCTPAAYREEARRKAGQSAQ